MIKKIRPNWWWLLGAIGLVGLFFNWIFFYQSDLSLLQNLFDNSQWRVPNSTRIISDSQLYEWAGYELIQGEPIYNINPEVPPLAKYLYGVAIVAWGNPYLMSFIFYLASILFFYLLAWQVIKDQNQVWWATILFALMPSVYRQITHAMLDLPQLLALLIHAWAVLKLLKKIPQPWHKWLLLVVAGLSLGAFAATKIALYLPLIIMADVWVLGRSKKWSYLFLILPLSGVFYLATYTAFFVQGGSLWQWLGNQKWMLEFYRSSQVKAIPFLAVITMMSGWYQGWWGESWQWVEVWNLLWPISIAATLLIAYQDRLKSAALSYFYLTFGGLLLLNALIPFWPRYYLLMLPFGLLLAIKKWGKLKWLMWGSLVMLLIQLFLFTHPQPTNLIKFFNEKASYGYWDDAYQFLSPSDRAKMSRFEFVDYMKNKTQNGSDHLNLTLSDQQRVYPWQMKTTAVLESQPVNLVRAEGDWKIDLAF